MEDKIEYTSENHYSKVITDRNDITNIKLKEPIKFIFTGHYSSEPTNITLHGKDCWIKKGELEILKQANINLEDIKVLAYTEGLIGPYKKCETTATAIDGYEIFILN
jgi:hypothetical protein